MIEKRKNTRNTGTSEQFVLPSDSISHIYSMGKKHYARPTKYLTAKQVDRLFIACEKAYALGHPLNRFFTIQYNDYATPKKPQKVITNILEHTRKWLQRRNLPVAYIYVLENGKYKGIHAHILVHIPPNYQVDYKRALRNWVPFEWSKQRINTKTIRYPSFGDLHPLNSIYGTLRYMCKGIDERTPIHSIKPGYQGIIYGQRYGISLSLR